MAIYTVHEPPLKKNESEPDPDRFVFVRDGFYFWAFLFGPLWMLRHRLWLVLLCYVLVTSALAIILRTVGASANVGSAVAFLVAVLIGCEAGTLRRFTLTRRGYRAVGLVVGDDRDSAERRFFQGWVEGGRTSTAILPPESELPGIPPALPPPGPALHRPQAGTGVLGLFPHPGASR